MADVEPSPTPTASARWRAHARNARARWRRLPLPARIILWIIGILFAIWLILFITKGRFLKGPVESIASNMIERPVRVGGDFQLYFAPVTIKFLAQDMRVANTSWASRPDVFRADLIDMRLSPLSLIFGDRYRIKWLELRNAAADLEWSRDGKSNT